MKTNTLIEIGIITDIHGKTFTAYAESLTFTGKGEDLDVTVEGIVLEHYTRGLLTTLNCASLSEMPDRFSQRQVNALEAFILETKRIENQAYAQDRYWDLKRGDV